MLKRENMEEYSRAKTDPQSLAVTAMRRKLEPYDKDNIRYIPTIEESIKRLDAVQLDDFKKVYEQIGSDRGELSIVGDFEPDTTLAAVANFLKDWKNAVPYARIDRPYTFDVKGSTEVIQTPDKENAVYLASVMAPVNDTDPDYAALLVGNYLLGGAPLASRLSNRVRGEEGLSYGIGSRYSADAKDKSSREMIFAITNPKNIGKVDKAISEVVEKYLKEGVSAAELEEGKNAFAESLKVQRSNDGTLATQLVNGLDYGRTYLFYAELDKNISALQPNDITAAAKKLIDPSKLVIIHAGDFNKK